MALAGRTNEPGIAAIEGSHLLEEALHSGLEILAVLASPAGEMRLGRLPIANGGAAGKPAFPVLRTSDRLFESVAGTQSPQGIAALVRLREYKLQELLRRPALVLVLIGVQDPGNAGMVVRSAEALGATGLMATAGTANVLAPKAIRASAGSAFRLPILVREQPLDVLAQLRSAGLRLLATSSLETGSDSRWKLPREIDFRFPTALLIGSEASGLPKAILRMADAVVRIPLAPPVESLNAAAAATVLLYEAASQRTGASAKASAESRLQE